MASRQKGWEVRWNCFQNEAVMPNYPNSLNGRDFPNKRCIEDVPRAWKTGRQIDIRKGNGDGTFLCCRKCLR